MQSTKFTEQARTRLISQLLKKIREVFQKLLKYLNGTAIFAFIIPSLLVFSKNFDLNLNDSVIQILL